MDSIRVFLALVSPLRRATLRATLARARGIVLVGEAPTAASVAEQLPICRPHVLIAEHGLLADAAVRAILGQRDAPCAVAVTMTQPPPATSDLPSIAVLPFVLSTEQWAAELRRILTPVADPAAPPEIPPDLRQRYHFTGPCEGSAPRPRVPSGSRPAPPPGPGRRRVPESRHTHLVSRLRLLQQRKDGVTGLAAPRALEQAWELLSPARQPVAFLRVEVRDERGAVQVPNFALLRRLSATLQANVRRDDVVCRAGPATFVVVLPGLRRDETPIPVGRVQLALEAACRHQAAEDGARLSVESSHWEAGSLPSVAFVQHLQPPQRGSGSLFPGDIL